MNKFEVILSYHSFHMREKIVIMVCCIFCSIVAGVGFIPPKDKNVEPKKAEIYRTIPKNCSINNVSTDTNVSTYTVVCK